VSPVRGAGLVDAVSPCPPRARAPCGSGQATPFGL